MTINNIEIVNQDIEHRWKRKSTADSSTHKLIDRAYSEEGEQYTLDTLLQTIIQCKEEEHENKLHRMMVGIKTTKVTP